MPSTRDSLEISRTDNLNHAERDRTRTIPSLEDDNTVYLDEDQVGVADQKIGFPHLLLCQGVICAMKDGSMIGAHFTSPGSQLQLTNRMINEMGNHGGAAGIDKMFVAYDERRLPAGMMNAQQKAEMFGFKGEVQFFDTSKMKNQPTEGTYVEVSKNGGGFEMSYAKHERMEHPKAEHRFPGSGQSQTVGANLKAGENLKPVGDKAQNVGGHGL